MTGRDAYGRFLALGHAGPDWDGLSVAEQQRWHRLTEELVHATFFTLAGDIRNYLGRFEHQIKLQQHQNRQGTQ